MEGKKLIDSNLDWFMFPGVYAPELPITFHGRKISFECGSDVMFIGENGLVSAYIPVYKTIETEGVSCEHCSQMNRSKEPYATIQIQGYTENDALKKNVGFLSSLFSNEPKSTPQSYIKIFCHMNFRASPSFCRIEADERGNDFLIYESPYIIRNENVCETVQVYLEKVMHELQAYTEKRFYSVAK
ncbi:hypothetical protein ACN930_001538 [Vibrio parahaemolyticus]|uniref:hypothetical protein n=1 Tax=Vibrio harveyi group TaxID=717610 RepID=UPI000A47EEBC|nr:hypothetical protein [Vibrio campbellii]MBE4732031.1 hypothetical protein [Vibrio parahaemolyticus]MBE4766018.1 hypothetical protein [Vibrio parahaemolyticus]HCE1837271.1 hypothetical protein [Vibrio parahaemolyticus]HCG6959554.1 hypothetical protein [Vibrio parahaemolyticus]HCM0790248.1 hypothetical protein [Vibrio parahaemolyticus]